MSEDLIRKLMKKSSCWILERSKRQKLKYKWDVIFYLFVCSTWPPTFPGQGGKPEYSQLFLNICTNRCCHKVKTRTKIQYTDISRFPKIHTNLMVLCLSFVWYFQTSIFLSIPRWTASFRMFMSIRWLPVLQSTVIIPRVCFALEKASVCPKPTYTTVKKLQQKVWKFDTITKMLHSILEGVFWSGVTQRK